MQDELMQDELMQDELMTPREVSALFSVDPKTVTRWADTGVLASFRTPGGHRRFRRSQIVALLSEDGQAAIAEQAGETTRAAVRKGHPRVIPARGDLAGRTFTVERLPADAAAIAELGAPDGAQNRLAVIDRRDGEFTCVAIVAPDDGSTVYSWLEGASAALSHVYGVPVVDLREHGQ